MPDLLDEYLSLSRQLGRPESDLAILGEGSVGARTENGAFFCKAGGYRLRDLGHDGVVRMRAKPLLQALGDSDGDEQALLLAAREEGKRVPCTETFSHAYLLSLPDVLFTAHTRPPSLMSLLCTEISEEVALQRLFPAEVIHCGPASCFVPYAAPGLEMAREVRDAVQAYMDDWRAVPKTLWVKNVGLFCTGRTPAEVENATLMSVKAARIWLGAFATGQNVTPLDEEQVELLATRPTEAYGRLDLGPVDR